ncbi:hypothetical protein LCGC14_0981060 [marine sediment metagenome]|uniref:Uncharacterized protein n=1 Tax=marine sediment metagenome TaxID=412755 RepID=A0A0F9ND46_9ZZZZ
MRRAFPLIHCVDDDTRAKLLGLIKELPPEPVWVEVGNDKKPTPFTPGIVEEDYDKIMRQMSS